MKISRFITSILVAASLVVGLVHLGYDRALSPHRSSSLDGDQPPAHYFVAADHASSERIDCPVKTDPRQTDVWSKEISPCWLLEGWTQPANWGSWAMGSVSKIEVDLQTAEARALMIRARSNPEIPAEQKQAVRVSVNGVDLGKQRVEQDWVSLRFEIPGEALRVGSNSISLTFDTGISPLQAGTGKDHRIFAARVTELILLAPVQPDRPATHHQPEVEIWDGERQSFVVSQSGIVALPVFIPSGSAEVVLDLRTSMSVDSSKIRTVLAIEDLDGGSASHSSLSIAAGRSLTTARLAVDDLNDRWALITLDVVIETGSIEVSEIRFTPGKAPKNPTPPAPPERQPDIILITLDAARADRFSFAGHSRETSPFIDQMAEGSLVFPNAYSLVPYTLCSVPTMITGLSFIDHGVTRHEDVLSPKAVTLAESLSEAGYHTACFSATPNNSKSKGFDQGYEVFRELWTEGPSKDTRRAHYMAERVVEWLSTVGDDERPLHLQIHMVPPHAPYDPPHEFDQFTDPAYDGPCDGYHRTVAALDGGAMEATPECIDHILDLYDGNIRTADDAVRIIIEALRDRPRWRDTVVLITSDHGEAFMDHGRMDHNSTLYSEMLHVPFVLRMPSDYDGSAVNTDQLVTLADITPTLLSAAGLRPRTSPDASDLLTPEADRTGRFMVTRTATGPPIDGLRTLRWNMVVNAAGSGALFDLTADPDERRNTRSRDTARYAGLGKILAARLNLPVQLATADSTADITDEERALLETLGYIRD